jgi:hypothetical protein
MYIDHSVYPDLDELPETLPTPEDKAEYVHRVCGAWDFGVHPEQETFELFSQWRDVFDRFPLYLSPAYHAFRAWFRWPPVDVPDGLTGPTPRYVLLDQQEGRGPDPCEHMV